MTFPFAPIIPEYRLALTAIEIISHMTADDHRAKYLLIYLCRNHPRAVGRTELMRAGGFLPPAGYKMPAMAPASFEFWMLRINDSLPLAGWRVREGGDRSAKTYWLETASPEMTERAARRFDIAA